MTRDTIRTYYRLTKPGIIYGNALAAIAGFLLAANGHIDLVKLLGALIGISLVIAAACVCNNYLDRGIDKRMERTRERALVSGAISGRNALGYAAVLGIIGFAALLFTTNVLTFALGIIAFVVYVTLYGYAKRKSIYGTLVGSVAGALPPAAGYTAVTGRFDAGAWLLFAVLTAWQMPHFYAIAIYRESDYANAGIPVLPVVKGFKRTRAEMIGYILVFLVAAAALTYYGYTGYTYLVVIMLVGGWWLGLALRGFTTTEPKRWARRVFFYSLIVLLVWCALLATNVFLP